MAVSPIALNKRYEIIADGVHIHPAMEEKDAAARRECLPDPTTADVVELQARVARLETLLAAQAQGKTIGGPAKTTPDVASDSE